MENTYRSYIANIGFYVEDLSSGRPRTDKPFTMLSYVMPSAMNSRVWCAVEVSGLGY
jgi:hypothetical protein